MSRRANDHLSGYEPYEERIRPVVLFAASLTAGTLVILVAMKLLANALDREGHEGSHPIHPLAASTQIPPEPRLQETPALDLEKLHAREREQLSTYGWVDRQAGIVHIPIERAMEIVAGEAKR
jgi:hypothetical protein